MVLPSCRLDAAPPLTDQPTLKVLPREMRQVVIRGGSEVFLSWSYLTPFADLEFLFWLIV